MKLPAVGCLVVVLLSVREGARASEGAPADASMLSSHGSPTGAVMPEPTLPRGLGKPAGPGEDPPPLALRLIVRPLDRGMLIRLPLIDTDPNRGFTFGFLPVLIVNSAKEDRIQSMHAPSLTYNPTFKTNFTHRYYYYPTKESTLMVRGAISQVLERELFVQYDNANVFGGNEEAGIKAQYNADASNRFFGVGPTTSKRAAANYLLKTLIVDGYYGMPIYKGSNWYWTVEHRLIGNKVADGPIKSIAGVTTLYPAAVPARFHQTSAFKAFITYDTLDSAITTTRGTYAESFAETSQRTLGSEYVYQRFSVDLRHFRRTSDDDTFVTAGRVKFEQVIGDGVPFFLLPYLGGKYLFPAYGDGRFTTQGVLAAVLEERVTLFRLKTGGVLTKYEVAPFAGLGSSFDTPGRMTSRYARPLVGVGLRAVAPPQVVGSIGLGIGQEGMNVFMDINYPF